MNVTKKIAIFASGNGSNAENIIRYFYGGEHGPLRVALVLTNRSTAGVIERAAGLNVPAVVLTKAQINDEAVLLPLLRRYEVEAIVLAGFLLMVPPFVLHAYPDRVVNIHPSLLPRHSGAGMYGARVHQAVVEAGDRVSGITIHLVNEEYDKGRILFQTECEVLPADTAADVERKIHHLEKEYFPKVLAEILL